MNEAPNPNQKKSRLRQTGITFGCIVVGGIAVLPAVGQIMDGRQASQEAAELEANLNNHRPTTVKILHDTVMPEVGDDVRSDHMVRNPIKLKGNHYASIAVGPDQRVTVDTFVSYSGNSLPFAVGLLSTCGVSPPATPDSPYNVWPDPCGVFVEFPRVSASTDKPELAGEIVSVP
jgi:hypothetical protein